MTKADRLKSSDFSNSWPERVFGSETEFTTNASLSKNATKSAGDSAFKLIEYVSPQYAVSTGRRTLDSVVTEYGGELYVDRQTLEYATAEVRDPADIVPQERGGETIAFDTVQNLAGTQKDIPPSLNRIYKRGGYARVYGTNDKMLIHRGTVGNHENYYSKSSLNDYMWDDIKHENAIDLRIGDDPKVQFMSSYLALRKLFDGTGMIGEHGFSLSQKPFAFKFDVFEATELHGEKPAFWVHRDRFEVRTGEGNKSDWVTEQKFGLTSLMLRLVEHDEIPDDLQLANPAKALRDISLDPFATVMLKNGSEPRGIDVLKAMVDEAAEFGYARGDLLPYEEKAVHEFDRFYRDLETVDLKENTIGKLGYVDWAARFRFFTDRGATFNTMDTRDLSLVRLDIVWDEIRDNDIARKYLSRLGGTALHMDPPLVTGRAKERITIARELHTANNLNYVSWDRVVPRPPLIIRPLVNPFGGNTDEQ